MLMYVDIYFPHFQSFFLLCQKAYAKIETSPSSSLFCESLYIRTLHLCHNCLWNIHFVSCFGGCPFCINDVSLNPSKKADYMDFSILHDFFSRNYIKKSSVIILISITMKVFDKIIDMNSIHHHISRIIYILWFF